MDSKNILFAVFMGLGGLALFVFGMRIMSDGLRDVAGKKLKSILHRSTNSKWRGVMLGSSIGFLIQSSASTVLLVGFINAGLLTLSGSIAPMMGANIGTTLSMQLISFRLGDFCYVAIALGFGLSLIPNLKLFGRTLLGFGLLFLGMNTMSEAITPYRDTLAPFLANFNGDTVSGMLKGVLAAALITGIIQSSGATIGAVFAMIHAGVITDLPGAYPIIIGANIGTCVTALLGSIGTSIDARRLAVSHLIFNLYSTTLGILTAGLFYRAMPLFTPDIIHQSANANTIKMVLSVLVLLPFSNGYARLIEHLVPSRKNPIEPSRLDVSLLSQPEDALVTVIKELRRVMRICRESLILNKEIFFEPNRRILTRIRKNEEILDTIKIALHDYLQTLTKRYLSRRQALLIQYLNRCMVDIERIGDHLEAIADLSVKRRSTPGARIDKRSLDLIFDLYNQTTDIISLVIDSFDIDRNETQSVARSILDARDAHIKKSHTAKHDFSERLEKHEIHPVAGMYISEYIAALDRIVRHTKSIALIEQRADFYIKQDKLGMRVDDKPLFKFAAKIEPEDYLSRLHADDHL